MTNGQQIVSALSKGQLTPTDLRRLGLARSRKAATMAIWRLREQGYEIITIPAGTRNGEVTYKLTRMPNSLAQTDG